MSPRRSSGPRCSASTAPGTCFEAARGSPRTSLSATKAESGRTAREVRCRESVAKRDGYNLRISAEFSSSTPMILRGGAIGREIHGEDTSALPDGESYAALPLDHSSKGGNDFSVTEAPKPDSPGALDREKSQGLLADDRHWLLFTTHGKG